MEKKATYPRINWTDGMKLNKDIFIAQDNAITMDLHNLSGSMLSPIKYGVLPKENNFNVQLSLDNQNTVRITVLACKAVTVGGVFINIDATEKNDQSDGNASVSISLPSNSNEVHWVLLLAKPFETLPFGDIDPAETPPRFPYVKPGYEIQLIPNHELLQYQQNPYVLTIGKLVPAGGTLRIDNEYLPPCLAVAASQDLLGLHSELDSFMAGLEMACSQIVQKILKKNQQNELAELAQFCCDRLILYLSKAITDFRWLYIHESPAQIIAAMVGLARVLKNTIDLRIGSGKDGSENYKKTNSTLENT